MNNRELLGVSQTAGTKEIKSAFRKAAKEVHPDHNNSPEAAEAFARIKEAHDALLKEVEAPRESVTATRAAAHASATTARTTYAAQSASSQTDEEIAKIQELDELARKSSKSTLFKKMKESAEVRRHRKKIKTNERRLRGLY